MMAATRKASNVRSAVTGDVYIGKAHAGDTIDGAVSYTHLTLPTIYSV